MGSITTIKAFGSHPAWMVFEDGSPIGEVLHIGFRQWKAEAMDDTRFSTPSKREAIMRLRIYSLAALTQP